MKRSLLSRSVLVLLAAGLLAGGAHAVTYDIDPVHSNVVFTIRHLVSRVSGGFTGVSGTIDYDPARPDSAAVAATIQVNTIDTNHGKRDSHLKSPDFFDAERYPVIGFRSTGVEVNGERMRVRGDLTMHGVTRQVVLPVEVLGLGTHPRSGLPVAGFAAETVLRRSDFGVNNWTDAAGVLGDEVTVRLNIEAVGRPAEPEGGEAGVPEGAAE